MALLFWYSNSEVGTFLPDSRRVGHQSPRTRQNRSEWLGGEAWCMPAEEKMNLLIIGTFAYGLGGQ